jgi:transcriptional regulator with XRE-family HTH domain
MMNGVYEIDKAELAKRARAARETKQMSQNDVAVEIGAAQSWVSALELGKVNFLGADHIKRAKDLAKVLDITVPYAGKPRQEDVTPKVVEPSPPPPRLPAQIPVQVRAEPVVIHRDDSDAEVQAIRDCCKALERLGNDKAACSRVIYYLRYRYGLPPRQDQIEAK